MKNQTMYRGNDNKKVKITKTDKLDAFVLKLRRKAIADATRKTKIA